MFRASRSPQQKPRSPGLPRTKNAKDRYLFRKKSRHPGGGLADFEVFRVCSLRLRKSWNSNGRSRQAARRLRLINHTSLSLGAWTPTLRTRTACSAAYRCNSGVYLQRTIWGPSFRASTATGAASSLTSRRARKFCNSLHRQPLCCAIENPVVARIVASSLSVLAFLPRAKLFPRTIRNRNRADDYDFADLEVPLTTAVIGSAIAARPGPRLGRA